MDWLERYRSGQHAEVWRVLRLFGEDVRDPEYVAQATAVCDEMARRARHNIEILVDRLTSQGYVFHDNDDDLTPVIPFIPATEKSADFADWLDEQPFGPMPLVVRSWVRLVGDVWLVGDHPDWPDSEAADPLVIEIEGARYAGTNWDFKSSWSDEYRDWEEGYRNWKYGHDEEDEEYPLFRLIVSPDQLVKENTSGSSGYGFEVPDRGADGTFSGETAAGIQWSVPFVDYLNEIFAKGGFAGSDYYVCPEPLRQELSRDLLEL